MLRLLRTSFVCSEWVRYRLLLAYTTDEAAASAGKEIQIVTSSLRADAVAAAGLDISRKKIWEACLEGHVMLNGEPLLKKSVNVKEGDIVEVDTNLKPCEGEGALVKRGRVVVKEIGPLTRKGGSHLTLVRFKQFALFKRKTATKCPF